MCVIAKVGGVRRCAELHIRVFGRFIHNRPRGSLQAPRECGRTASGCEMSSLWSLRSARIESEVVKRSGRLPQLQSHRGRKETS